ncbi:tyrosine-protein phosphatase [Antribacter gilvus]|uniref:tyrosine-protein phosphatase n=1 Tax=Antribacter gilvus TaxID=2304675 RepID=UPI000F786E5C|nr:tyrosine-protein phosphatase [Antribacter gilvus]
MRSEPGPTAELASHGDAGSCLANFRDVATTVRGVRPGVLLRSDAPHSADTAPAGASVWPPRTVLDLRDTTEGRESHPFGGASTVLSLPLLQGGTGAPRGLPRTLTELYLRMLAPPAASMVVEAVTTVARGETPVLVHCTAGKDRTGVTVAVALALAGVDRAEIVADFVLTEVGMPGVLARIPRTARFATPAAKSAKTAEIAAELFTAPAHAMEAFLDALDAYDGGAEGWFAAHGGSAGALAELRARLVA